LEAAPAKKNTSTSVNKKKSKKTTSKVANAGRRVETRTRSTSPEEDAAIRRALELRSGSMPSRVAVTAEEKNPPAAATPRAADQVDNTRTSSPQLKPPAEDPALREALARRREWTEPRQSLLQPAKVKDPPAIDRPGQTMEADSDPAPTVGAAVDEEALLARRSPESEKANEDLIREALSRRGTPYVWGGASRGGFDCSGFVCYVFDKMRGLKLPHSASAQSRLGAPVQKGDLQSGDVVFFTTYRSGVSHVGIYVGGGKFVHAANSRKGTRVDTLTSGYYAKRYVCARRYGKAPWKPDELKPYIQNSSELPPVNGMQ
jgi:cell wall-associated NlpC family hydrolase